MEERERMLDTIMEMQRWNGIKDKQIEELEQENQALKDRWENFKKWIADTKALRGSSTYFLQETLLEKMQELEDRQ